MLVAGLGGIAGGWVESFGIAKSHWEMRRYAGSNRTDGPRPNSPRNYNGELDERSDWPLIRASRNSTIFQ